MANRLAAVLALTLSTLSGFAWADDTKAAPAIPNDSTNYLSDRIKFSFALAVRRVDLTKADHNVSDACAPAFTTFRGIGRLEVGSKQESAFIITFVPDEAAAAQADPRRAARCTAATVVRVNDIVVLDDKQLVSTPPDRYGLTYGSLLVPYKYQLSGDHSFGSKASVGAYLGFRQDKSGLTGVALQYVGFIGAATVPVVQNVDGESKTQQLAGVSYGVGLLGTVKSTFQMGIVIGADRVSRSANYVNNGKPWIAVSLGWSFAE